ncbi:MAG: phosphate ABC transporter permease PstC, partial [Hyphomicrobiales bacterium]|nr:phosphate ABC transporter permease PstC [Hyphomicrobiales bacterium]
MADIADASPIQPAHAMRVAFAAPADRSGALARLRFADALFERATFGAAALVPLVMSGILVALVVGAWPALAKFGAGFL